MVNRKIQPYFPCRHIPKFHTNSLTLLLPVALKILFLFAFKKMYHNNYNVALNIFGILNFSDKKSSTSSMLPSTHP